MNGMSPEQDQAAEEMAELLADTVNGLYRIYHKDNKGRESVFRLSHRMLTLCETLGVKGSFIQSLDFHVMSGTLAEELRANHKERK